jgi:hypothetical protein
MIPVSLNISFWWRGSNEPEDAFALRAKAYVVALGDIDPHFKDVGIDPRKGAIEVMPDDKLGRYAVQQQGVWSVATLTKALRQKGETVRVHFAVGRISLEYPNANTNSHVTIKLDDTSSLARNEKVLRQIFEFTVSYWSAEEAIIDRFDLYEVRGGGQFIWLHWLRSGSNPLIKPRFFKPIDQPAATEPWHSGTLKTWPQWAPWIALPGVNQGATEGFEASDGE